MTGRPKKEKKEKTENTEKQELNIDEIVAQKVAELMAQKELELKLKIEQELKAKEKTENVDKKTKKIKPSERRRMRKYVSDDTMVRLEQNIDGKFIIADTRGSNYFIELNGYGDSTTMSFKDLKNYHGKHHTFLNKGKLKIVDVSSEKDDISFEDVIQDLNLQGIYENDEKISPLDIEYYLLEEEDLNVFSKKIRKSKELLEVIVEVSTLFYKDNNFNDNAKMDVLRQVAGNYDLFKNTNMPSNVRKVSNDIWI
jgi:hypothetical protein